MLSVLQAERLEVGPEERRQRPVVEDLGTLMRTIAGVLLHALGVIRWKSAPHSVFSGRPG